jgi:hypothetical protein
MGGLEKSTKSYISVERRRSMMIIDRIIPTRGELQKRFYETEGKPNGSRCAMNENNDHQHASFADIILTAVVALFRSKDLAQEGKRGVKCRLFHRLLNEDVALL